EAVVVGGLEPEPLEPIAVDQHHPADVVISSKPDAVRTGGVHDDYLAGSDFGLDLVTKPCHLLPQPLDRRRVVCPRARIVAHRRDLLWVPSTAPGSYHCAGATVRLRSKTSCYPYPPFSREHVS